MIVRTIGRFLVSVANLFEAEGRALKRNVKQFAEEEGRALRRNIEEMAEQQRANCSRQMAGLVLTCCLVCAAVSLIFLGTGIVLAGLYLALEQAMGEPAPAALITGAITVLGGLLALAAMQNRLR